MSVSTSPDEPLTPSNVPTSAQAKRASTLYEIVNDGLRTNDEESEDLDAEAHERTDWPLSSNPTSPISTEQNIQVNEQQDKADWNVERDVSDVEDREEHDELYSDIEEDEDQHKNDISENARKRMKIETLQADNFRPSFDSSMDIQSSNRSSISNGVGTADTTQSSYLQSTDRRLQFAAIPNEPYHAQSLPGLRQFSNGKNGIQHTRQSSIAKTGLHSRQSSYNPYNTTQIPHNRDRVRYSWQSLQGDEPNRPRIHIIKLVSNTTSASSAFPQGEAFGFSISPAGRRIAAYDSSRLYVLQTAALPVGITQDFSLKRRPLAVELTDDGELIAILADNHTVNIYDLAGSKLRRSHTFKLDFPASCIAIAPCGGLLAAAYDGGIEVFSLAHSALSTDRRAVRSPRMDKLTFSEDGSTLLGTTTKIHTSSTVLISVPVFPATADNIPTAEELKLAWCSELLHPENVRNSSHATYMREDRSTCNDKIFAWNGLADTFGILDTSNMVYGNADFPVVIQPPLSTCGGLGAAVHSCPAVDEFGDIVAMIVNDRTIRLYIVPSTDTPASVEAHSIDHELDEGYGAPFSDLRWVHSHSSLPAPVSHTQVKGRLIVTSPGGVLGQEQMEESFEEVEGGRIILLDFDAQFSGQPGQTFVLNLGKSPAQPLEEEEVNVAEAVALARKRTIKQNKAGDLSHRPVSLGRAATTTNTARPVPRPSSTAMSSRRTTSMLSVGSSEAYTLPDVVEGVEAAEAIEEPFSNTAPRSQVSLQRAATNVQRHRFQTLEEREQEQESVESHGNFLALPEYTEEPNAPLPGRYRALAGLDQPKFISTPPLSTNRNSYIDTAPLTAPPSTGESFSAEEAFAAANATLGANNMPRSLLRAYSNAQNPGVGQLSQDYRRSSAYGDSFTGNHRLSTPLSSLAEQPQIPRRSLSSRRPGEPVHGTRGYQMHPVRQSYASASASLFPQSQSSDHVPLPHNRLPQSIGTVAHPVTSWRPPGATGQVVPTATIQRRQSRKSTIANRQAFASTAKAKKLGFFKKSKGKSSGVNDDMVDESRSMTSWRISEKKCTMM